MPVPAVEVHVPISPTLPFLTMVRCLVGSLRRNGGRHAGSRVVVTVGAEPMPPDLEARLPWLGGSGVELRRTPPHRFAEESYGATFVERFRYGFDADVALLVDADVLFVAPLDDLVAELAAGGELAARIGGATPFWGGRDRWQALYDRAGLGTVQRPYRYGAWPYDGPGGADGWDPAKPEHRDAPPYPNLGVVAGRGETINRVGARLYDRMALVRSVVDSRYWVQIAATLALVETEIPFRPLGYRYNFPNSQAIEALYPEELADARIVHLLGRSQGVHKGDVFRDVEALERFAARSDLAGANEKARRAIAPLLPELRAVPTATGSLPAGPAARPGGVLRRLAAGARRAGGRFGISSPRRRRSGG